MHERGPSQLTTRTHRATQDLQDEDATLNTDDGGIPSIGLTIQRQASLADTTKKVIFLPTLSEGGLVSLEEPNEKCGFILR